MSQQVLEWVSGIRLDFISESVNPPRKVKYHLSPIEEKARDAMVTDLINKQIVRE